MSDDPAPEAERAERARELRLIHATQRKRKAGYAGRLRRSISRQRTATPPDAE